MTANGSRSNARAGAKLSTTLVSAVSAGVRSASDRTARRAMPGSPRASRGIVGGSVGNKLDRTTGLHAIVGPPAGGAWYLIVALDDQHNTRVVPLDDGAELVFGRSAESSV